MQIRKFAYLTIGTNFGSLYKVTAEILLTL